MSTLADLGFKRVPMRLRAPVQNRVLLRVMPVPGEPTRFWVESGSLQCVLCGKLFNRRLKPRLRVGGPCPGGWPVLHHERVHVECGGTLDVRFHLVDVAAFSTCGQCSCEFFEFSMHKILEGLPPEIQALGKYRCSHIDAARDYALNLVIVNHEIGRYKDANGQREESQP